MKKSKKVFALIFAVMMLTSGMTVFAQEHVAETERQSALSQIGCGNWSKSYGTPYCSNEACPGGFTKKLQNVYYSRRCVRSNNQVYWENKSSIQFVSCSCY